jgi:hypothetical protein
MKFVIFYIFIFFGFTSLGQDVYVYSEAKDIEKSPWSPSGFMPDGGGLGINTNCSENPLKGKTCIKTFYNSNTHAWAGIYWLSPEGWKATKGTDVCRKLSIDDENVVFMGFWARGSDGDENVEFKFGGVKAGELAISTGVRKLDKRWQFYRIPLAGAMLKNVTAPFGWVANRENNPNKALVCFYIDEIKFSAYKASPISEKKLKKLSKKIKSTKWVCYSPTGYNPVSIPVIPATLENIRADLQVLKKYFNGVITYGCENGLEKIPGQAKSLSFSGIIVGIWDPLNKIEIENAINLARKQNIDAICIGNEQLGKLYSWETLAAVMDEIRHKTNLPVTTTEEIDDYGDSKLLLEPDFIFVNIHPLWHEIKSPQEAAAWVIAYVETLEKKSNGKTVFVKETGFPSKGPKY